MISPTPYDVVIVGGGVLGCSVAARLSRTTAKVALVEARSDIAEGASKGNAGIVSAYYSPKGTLEAQLLNDSIHRWEDICARLDVPFRRCGTLTCALDDEQEAALEPMADKQREVGLTPRVISGEEARAIEPLLSHQVQAALFLPEEGIIDPFRLTWGYAELAATNGVEVYLSHPVVGFEHGESGEITAVVTPTKTLRTRFVVNAAGIGSGSVSALAGGEEFRTWARKGEYWVLDREFGSQLQTTVVPVPGKSSRGVQVVPTTHRSALLGPDSHDDTDRYDASTDHDSLAALVEMTQKLIPTVSAELAIKTYAANRPASDEPVKVRTDIKVANLVQVMNRSTGVSASPATADATLAVLDDLGLAFDEDAGAVDRLPAVPRLFFEEDPTRLAGVDPRYRQVICVCEQVSAAEVAAAVTARVPARSIEGVRKRTRATGGRCQGAYCLAGVTLSCGLAMNCGPGQVGQGPRDGTIGVGGG